MNKFLKTAGAAAALGAVAVVGLPASEAHADEAWPCTIEVVIHSSYGGGTDATARMMMIRSRRNLKADMTVVAKRGGSGASAQNYVMSRPADGCTIMALTQTHLYTMARGKSDMGINDLVGVARAMDDPTLITVSANGPYQTLEDLVNASKNEPLNWGVAQIGGTEHIGLANFAKEAGIKFKVVPFGSGAQMVQALLSGAIDATLPNVSEAGAQVEDGSFRALAVMAADRLGDYPDVPTTVEKGYDVLTSTTRGYGVKAGTPPEVIEKLSEQLVKAMKHDVFAGYLINSGLDPETSPAPTDVWDAQLKAEYEKAKTALAELGLK